MPQANITYDIPYNRKLVDVLSEMDEKHWRKAGDAYAPTMFSEKLGNFHGAKIGGGSPANQKFALSGNSPAYPPINMNSGMAVHSGGSYAGIDGAVGGYSFNDFMGDVANVGKQISPLAPLLKGLGRKKKGGSKVGDQIANVFKTIAPFAPLLMGLGRPAPTTKMDIVNALAPLGAKKSHSYAKLHAIVAPYKTKTGGFSFSKLISDLGKGVKSVGNAVVSNPIVQDVGKDLLKQGLNMGKDALLDYAKGKASGAGRKSKKVSGGASLESMVELVKPMEMSVSKGKGKKAVVSGAGAGGRAKRAEIVKKIMKEKGMKMIEASKYVKAHNLY